MQIWNTSQIPSSEKEDILAKHREVYNGFRTMQPEVKNNQPLYVQDFAKDKLGATITNDGKVKPYTDYRINESHVMDTCEQCGGVMSENECSECGYKMEEMGEDDMSLDDENMETGDELHSFDTEGNFLGMTKPNRDMETSDEVPSFDPEGNFLGMTKPNRDMEEMNEEKSMCFECGGMMREGECSECGYKMQEELQELGIEDLYTGKKYKYKSPAFDDEIEFDREVEDKSGGKKMYKFKGKKAHHLMGDRDVESYVSSDIDETKYPKGKLDDIYDEEDFNPKSDFDYVEGGGNDYGTFEKMHHMKKIKNEETATSNAPLSYGKHYNEIEPPYDFKSNGPVGNGGTLRQKNIKEQTVGGGNAAVYDPHFDELSYDFKSKGPIEDTFTEPADDMDLEDGVAWEPFDYVSGGAENGGDVYPVNEDECEECWEKMESAFAEEVDEQDVSGVQGMYGKTKKPFAFVSTGPGKAGPYQTHSWGGEQLSSDIDEEYEGEDEDVYWEKDLEPGELDLDLTKFNPRDKSWSEITAYTGEDEFSHLDEEVKEKLEIQQEKILEMFQRFKKYN